MKAHCFENAYVWTWPYLNITNILVVFTQIRYTDEVFDLTNPRYNELISQSPGTSLNRGSTVTTYMNMTYHEYQGMFDIAPFLKKLSKLAQ